MQAGTGTRPCDCNNLDVGAGAPVPARNITRLLDEQTASTRKIFGLKTI